MFWAKSTLFKTFCFKLARLQVYVAITCYPLLHQTTNCEGKNSFRERRDILVSGRDPQTILLDYTTLTLIYDVLSSFMLYYIQFKEVKILWRLGAGDWRPGTNDRIIQTPFLSNINKHTIHLTLLKCLDLNHFSFFSYFT